MEPKEITPEQHSALMAHSLGKTSLLTLDLTCMTDSRLIEAQVVKHVESLVDSKELTFEFCKQTTYDEDRPWRSLVKLLCVARLNGDIILTKEATFDTQSNEELLRNTLQEIVRSASAVIHQASRGLHHLFSSPEFFGTLFENCRAAIDKTPEPPDTIEKS